MSEAKAPTAVAVGIVFDAKGRALFAQRPSGKPYAGWWEFPGGKIEPGESVQEALTRELEEELGLTVIECRRWITRTHVYPHATVQLHFCKITAFSGEPQSLEGQAFQWDDPVRPVVGPILPAALPLLPWLALPEILALYSEHWHGNDAIGRDWVLFDEAQAVAGDAQPRFVQALQTRELNGATLIVSSRHPQAWAQQADAQCLSESDLLTTQARPALRWVGAQVYTRDALEHAARIGCDFAVLAPRRDSTAALQWDTVGRTIEATPIPVYLRGGLSGTDLTHALAVGAQGIVI